MKAEATRIERIDAGFSEWDELLALILDAFGVHGPADRPALLGPPADIRLAQAQSRGGDGVRRPRGRDFVGCVFCKSEPDCLYVGKLAVRPDRHGPASDGA